MAVEYDVNQQELRCERIKAKVPLVDGKLNLRVILDRTSLEIMAGQGEVLMPIPHLFEDRIKTIQLQATGIIDHADVHELQSIWK